MTQLLGGGVAFEHSGFQLYTAGDEIVTPGGRRYRLVRVIGADGKAIVEDLDSGVRYQTVIED